MLCPDSIHFPCPGFTDGDGGLDYSLNESPDSWGVSCSAERSIHAYFNGNGEGTGFNCFGHYDARKYTLNYSVAWLGDCGFVDPEAVFSVILLCGWGAAKRMLRRRG